MRTTAGHYGFHSIVTTVTSHYPLLFNANRGFASDLTNPFPFLIFSPGAK